MTVISPETGTPALEVQCVSKSFGGVSVLQDLSLRVDAGALRCIIGPNGCGKTTLYNIITGTFPPTSGRVRVAGRDVTGCRPETIARLGVSRKFQVPGVYPELSVQENLELPLAARGGAGPVRMLRRNSRSGELRDLLALCGLTSKHTHRVGTLSHGEKQWLEIAMVLASDARLILLDEPNAGMSVGETRKTAELIERLRGAFGRTVLVIAHDMTFVRLLNCPVVVMLDGAVLREGSYEVIRTDARVIHAYLGERAGVC